MVALVVLWIVVMFAGTRWLARRTSRLRLMEGIDGGPEGRLPDAPFEDFQIPDTVPSEWVDAYRNE